MSATINAEKFSEYFNGASIIRIPGKIHPLTQYFLEDLVADNLVPQDATAKVLVPHLFLSRMKAMLPAKQYLQPETLFE
ncbi:uncharacterized protein LOC144107616 [Amblyomma americanum]